MDNITSEPWRTDGTPEGTFQLRDINPGGYSTPRFFPAAGGTVFFSADDGVHGRELWKTDGTPEGTQLVKDIWPGSTGSALEYSTSAILNGQLFFTAQTSANGFEPWISDGTEAGTMMLKDVFPGSASANLARLTIFKGTAYFEAFDGGAYDIWKTDGTPAGTAKAGLPGLTGALAAAAGPWLLYQSGTELWRTDGTTEGTAKLADAKMERAGQPAPIEINGLVFFTAFQNDSGWELWKTDGTPEGTLQVKDIHPGPESSYPRALTSKDGLLFFIAQDPEHGHELWRSDGTSPGTWLVKDLSPGPGSSFSWFVNPNHRTHLESFITANDTLWFAADDGVHGTEPWKSDGTEAGTLLMQDLNPGIATSMTSSAFIGDRLWLNADGFVYFSAFDGETRGLFRMKF
ncbi:MAG: hypothetical protein NDJ89_17150 [Oligoflexia bacterium]|nr:hypothetical protein [Oligoflexia bacterium]